MSDSHLEESKMDEGTLDGPSSLAQPAVTKHGGRVELRWSQERTSDDSVCYFARWFISERAGTDGDALTGWVYVHAPQPGAKAPLVVIEQSELPDWMENFTTTLLRTTARGALVDGAAFGRGNWPRRLTRWRKDPGE